MDTVDSYRWTRGCSQGFLEYVSAEGEGVRMRGRESEGVSVDAILSWMSLFVGYTTRSVLSLSLRSFIHST